MFTGIVREIGIVETQRPRARGKTFRIRAPDTAGTGSAGDSVAVNGVCLTVEAVDGDHLEFTAVGETLRRTTLGDLAPGSPVNLEPAATLETALGGHLVQGHVDGVGTVESFAGDGEDHLLTVRLPETLARFVVGKGSIAIDGVSLTVVEAGAAAVRIAIIPFTMEHTIAGRYAPGVNVNVETDIVGKYVVRYLERMNTGAAAGALGESGRGER